MKNRITIELKKVTIVLIMAISSLSAYNIDVVNCRSALRNDPPPSDKIVNFVYDDIKQHSDEFVCAYNPCDFNHEEGWFAIKKDRTMLFWNKNDEETMTIYYDSKRKKFILITFNKYGIANVHGFSGDKLDMLIDDVFLAGVQRCSN